MDNTLYVALSRQMTLRREFDLVANNIANAETVGFKVESLMVENEPTRPTGPAAKTGPIGFVLDGAVARDFTEGAMKPTGNPLDLAIAGDGFFKINTPDGERYTRDGRFSMDDTGRVITAAGHPLMGDGGDIILDPLQGPPKIGQDGTVSQNAGAVGRIGLARFASLAALSKQGDGLYANVSNVPAEAATAAKIAQGSVEASNVQAISQITRLIEVSRAYESTAKLMDRTGELNSSAVQRLGRVN